MPRLPMAAKAPKNRKTKQTPYPIPCEGCGRNIWGMYQIPQGGELCRKCCEPDKSTLWQSSASDLKAWQEAKLDEARSRNKEGFTWRDMQ